MLLPCSAGDSSCSCDARLPICAMIAAPPLRSLAACRFCAGLSGGSPPRLASMVSNCATVCCANNASAALGSVGAAAGGDAGGGVACAGCATGAVVDALDVEVDLDLVVLLVVVIMV